MARSLLCLAIALVVVAGIAKGQGNNEGHCIWTGTCGPHPEYPDQKCLNCAYPGPARPLDPSLLDLLDQACPHIRLEKGENLPRI